MTPSPRRFSAAVLCVCALAGGGCAAPGGLGVGSAAPPVSSQPRPEPLWPAWSDAPGAAVGRREPAPVPLKNAPEVGTDGLAGIDPGAIAAADPRMKPYLGKGNAIEGPGRAGVRPPVYKDLTGDGKPDLILAADQASGLAALSVYAVADGKIVAVLFTIGRRLAAESIGSDLLVRIAADDGSVQAVRYHWDGDRMAVVNDERTFRVPEPSCGPGDTRGGDSDSGRSGR